MSVEDLRVGRTAFLTATFRDLDTRRPVDVVEPVTFTVHPPSGADELVTGTRMATGVYRAAFTPAINGAHTVVAESDDGIQVDDAFSVFPPVLPEIDLVTAGDLAAHEADYTNVHGIVDTRQLATLADLAGVTGQPGPPGASFVFFSETQPSVPGPWIWYKVDSSGTLLDIVVESVVGA